MRIRPKQEQLRKAKGKLALPDRAAVNRYNAKKGKQLAKTFEKRTRATISEESAYGREHRLLGELNKIYRQTDPFMATWKVNENDTRRDQLKRLMKI
jgi:hypothetical protein